MALEARVTVYVELVDEAVEVYRPVLATPLGGDLYRLDSGPEAPEEAWSFKPNAVVRCRPVRFEQGPGLLAVEAVDQEEDCGAGAAPQSQ